MSKDTFARLHPRNFISFFPGEVANVSNLLSAQDSQEGHAQVSTFHPPEDPPDSVSKVCSRLGEDECLNRVDSEIRNSVLPFPGDNQLQVVSSSGKLIVSNTLSLATDQSKSDHGYATTVDLVDGKGPLGFEHFSDSPTFTCIVNDEALLDAPPDLCSGEMEDSIVLEPDPKSLPEALLEQVLHTPADFKPGKICSTAKSLSPFSSFLKDRNLSRKLRVNHAQNVPESNACRTRKLR